MAKKPTVPFDTWQAERDHQVAVRFKLPEKPLTPNHIAYQQAIEAKNVVIAIGPAGTGKTTLACAIAVKMLKAGTIKRIVLTRPIVTCDEELGILPGSILEKLAPYLAPLEQAIRPHYTAFEYDRMVAADTIEVCPLGVMRGRTFTDAIVICDEAQNMTLPQIRMLLTRLGERSHFVVNGDVTQSDTSDEGRPLLHAINKLTGNPDIAVVKMSRKDCLRPALVQWIDQRLG